MWHAPLCGTPLTRRAHQTSQAAEALGSIATDEAEAALRSAMEAADHPIVAQACEVALDILACERSGEEYIAPLTEEEEEALANGN